MNEFSGWRTLRGALAAALLLAVAACSTTPTYQPSGDDALFRSMAAPGAVLDTRLAATIVSGFRANNGLGAVTLDPALTRLAQQQAAAMARADRMSHNVAGTLEKRAKAEGYQYARIAENIAAGHDTLADVFAGWRDSRGHRENMLMPGATRVGFAVQQAPRSRFKVYWAMVIAEPDRPPAAAAAGPAPGQTVLLFGGAPVPAQ